MSIVTIAITSQFEESVAGMSDLITKQDAVDAVHHSIFEFFDVDEHDDKSPMTYNDKRLLEMNKSICSRIKDLTPADVVTKEQYANLLAKSIIVCEALKKYQSADVVEVVRCKECKFFLGSDEKCALIDTRLHFYETDNTWTNECFCAWGERREDG